MATQAEVVQFLHKLKSCIQVGHLSIRGREKNRQGLIDLGISPEERRQTLLALVPEDYVSGPNPDDTDDTKEVWVFGKKIESQTVYIKLRVVDDPVKHKAHQAMVWSFHPAEHRMRYPLKGGRGS